VGGKQMENAFVYIKIQHVQEASSTPCPELQSKGIGIWKKERCNLHPLGRMGVAGAKGQTDYY